MAELLALSAPPKGEGAAHIVFIHGLNGDKLATWRSPDRDESLWPLWLASDDSNIEVWSVGYDASSTQWRGYSMPLVDRAENILARLLAEPRLTHGNITFVCHSLGGLIVKQALRSAERDAQQNPAAESFLHRVRRVVFLGTPHFGASLASVADVFRILARPSSSTSDLQRNAPLLRDLNHWYRQFSTKSSIENLVLSEIRPVKKLGISIAYIVLPDSSDPGVGVTPIPIDADHINIAKPANRDSEVYILVKNFALKPHLGVHRDGVIAETLTQQGAELRRLSEAVEQNTGHQIDASKLLFAYQAAPSRYSPIIDDEANARLTKLRKSRFFVGFDVISETRRLIQALESGELADVSADCKSRMFAWCIRLISASDIDTANRLFSLATALGRSEDLVIADAFLRGYKDDLDSALGCLASLNSGPGRSAAFVILNLRRGIDEALKWLAEGQINLNDLDSDGKFFVLRGHLQRENWAAALEVAEALADGDFSQTPALLHTAAAAHLVQAIPLELRSFGIQQLPFEAASFPLAADEPSLNHRRTAQTFFERTSDAAKSLGLDRQGYLASDLALWLALRDPNQFSVAVVSLGNSIRDPAISLRRLPLALQFGLKVDLPAVEAEINRQTVLTGGESPDAAVARFALALTLNDPARIINYITRHRDQLSKHIDHRALGFAEIELLAAAGLAQHAQVKLTELASVGLSPSERSRLERIIIESAGGDPIAQRMAAYDSSKSVTDLRNLVVALEEKKDWESLIPFAKLMMESTHDLADVKRYAQALHQTYQLDALIQLLADFENLVTHSEHLQLLKTWALFHNGNLAGANAALAMFAKDKHDENWRQLRINLALASGDWDSLQIVVEDTWNERESRAPADLLRVAMLAQLINSSRAKQLVFESAARGKDDPSILSGCYHAACEAGWEDSEQVAGWLTSAIALSGDDGPMQRISLQELFDRQPEWQRHETETWTNLTRGETPMFAAAHLLNRSLLSLTLLPALANPQESDVRKRFLIPAYSGARIGWVGDPTSLAIEITALITMELLGITDMLLSNFDRIVISHDTLSWLFEEKRKILFHQPSRIANAQELRRLLSDGSLKVLETTTVTSAKLEEEIGASLATMVSEANVVREGDPRQRLVIAPYPIRRPGSLAQEEADLCGYQTSFASCAAVIDKLANRAELTSGEAEVCRAYLALHEQPWPHAPRVQDSAVLYLDDVAISYLEHLKLLPRISKAGLAVYVSSSHVEEADRFIAHNAQVTKAISFLDGLRLKLRDGISAGKVALAPQPRPQRDDVSPLHFNPTMQIFAASNADAIVIDDRSLNRHRGITFESKESPLLTTLDLLDLLRTRNLISPHRFCELRAALRRSGYSLIPFELGELHQTLQTCKVEGGRLVETAEVRTMREGVLRLQMLDTLQLPQELPWLGGFFDVCRNAIFAQWDEDLDKAKASAASEWLLELMDARAWSHRYAGGAEEGLERYRLQLYSLLVLPPGKSRAIRSAYAEWLEAAVLSPVRDCDLKLFDLLVSRVREQLIPSLENRLPPDGISPDLFPSLIVRNVLSLLPPSVRQALLRDHDFTERYRLAVTTRLAIGATGQSFVEDRFFDAIRQALRTPGTSASLLAADGATWTIEMQTEDGVKQTLLSSKGQRVLLPYFWAFSSDQRERLEFFDREAKSANLEEDLVVSYRKRLADTPATDNLWNEIRSELAQAPSVVSEAITECMTKGNCSLGALIPVTAHYYERLVGILPGDCTDAASYAENLAASHVSRLLSWDPINGSKHALLLSAHPSVALTINLRTLTNDQIVELFEWVLQSGDILSKLGAVEVGLAHLDVAAIEPLLESIIDQIRTDDPEDNGGHFRLFSSLALLVLDELSSNNCFNEPPPFWIRLAAFAQAGLIQRSVITAGVDPAAFGSWASEGRGQTFYLKAQADLRREPRWLPDFLSAEQLKANFLGRIYMRGHFHKEKIRSEGLRHLLLDEGPRSVRATMDAVRAFLPGPIEGGASSEIPIPADALSDIEQRLMSDRLEPDTFTGLINAALLFRVDAEQARIAAAVIRRAKYQVEISGSKAEMVDLLRGLAIVAAVSRSPELANEIRILARVTRRRHPDQMSLGAELRIALEASAAHKVLGDWATFLGDWVSEMSLDAAGGNGAGIALSHVNHLIEMEPTLAAPCAKGRAALSALVGY